VQEVRGTFKIYNEIQNYNNQTTIATMYFYTILYSLMWVNFGID